jgi:hypothetical protein
MNDNAQDAIRQADLLMKEGKYKSARNLLLPYKSDPAARKRLIWLEQKRKQATTSENKVITASNSGRSRLYILITVVVILLVGGFVIYRLMQQNQNPVTPTQVAESTSSVAVAATESSSATPSVVPSATVTATPIPPTEDSHEVTLQQQLRDWLGTVDGVSKVLSFDVDLPGDESPLGYVEIVVKSGSNDTHIPDKIVEKLKTELKTTQFTDLAVIMSDGSTTTEYDYDSKANTWNQTVLTFTAVPAD